MQLLYAEWANPDLFFFMFVLSHKIQIKIGKSLDVVHGIRTSGRRIVGTDGTIGGRP